MELKEDVWYVIDKERDRASFIIALSKATKLTERDLRAKCDNLYTAKVLKWKTKCIDPFIVDINYRSEFKPDYLKGKIEHFSPVPTVELRPFDLATYKDNSILTSNVIKEWVDKEIAKRIMQQDVRSPNTIVSTVGPINIQDELEKFKPYIKNDNDNTITKIYEGDNNMICSNEYNEKYLIQQYFEKEEKRLTDEKIKERDEYLNNTTIYTSAKTFINILNCNKSNPFTPVPTPFTMIKEYLSKDQMEALNKIDNKYNEEVEKVRLYCKEVESLINMCDNADQKMDILRRYEIIKLPKMPK